MRLLSVNEFSGLTENECIAIQNELSEELVRSCPLAFDEIRTVAGVDLAYWSGRAEYAVCCIVVIDVKSRKIIEKQWSAGRVNFPYVPGCLAFRELPLVVETAAKLGQKPNVYLFDGNGTLHPRRMGLAAHASFYLDAPTAGIAKHYFKVDGAEFTVPDNEKGSVSDIVKDGAILGRIVRTQSGVKPVYVSVGDRMDIDTAVRLALSLTDSESRIPIPTRYADLETHIMRKELQSDPNFLLHTK
ncbi:MAG: endonuclease V [Oscillospiraceae bacterium]|nr:endonuclease V [Oscillospiraceae bacterium]